MNSWKLNSISNVVLRQAISSSLSILIVAVYKTVKTIDNISQIIETNYGKKYQLILKEI